jgi:hypothetical protein
MENNVTRIYIVKGGINFNHERQLARPDSTAVTHRDELRLWKYVWSSMVIMGATGDISRANAGVWRRQPSVNIYIALVYPM